MEYRQVSKEEFDKFIKDYPNQLTSSVMRICEPPLVHFRDDLLPTDGVCGDADYFYDKVVAKICMDWMRDGEIDRENHKRFWEYSILEQ